MPAGTHRRTSGIAAGANGRLTDGDRTSENRSTWALTGSGQSWIGATRSLCANLLHRLPATEGVPCDDTGVGEPHSRSEGIAVNDAALGHQQRRLGAAAHSARFLRGRLCWRRCRVDADQISASRSSTAPDLYRATENLPFADLNWG